MNMQHLKFVAIDDSKSKPQARGHIMGRLEKANDSKIHSVFLSNRNFRSNVNWQSELLKLEDAS